MPKCPSVCVLFDGTFDGFLTIIHAHYYDRLEPDYIFESGSYQQTIGSSYVNVEADAIKSEVVFRAIKEKISPDAASSVYYSFLCFEPDRFMNIYRYILLGFKTGADVDAYMKYDYVIYVRRTAKYVGGEAHLLTGFCRFTETERGVLYAKIGPNNNVLPLVANHFADRLMNEQWIIHDEKRKTAAVYDGSEFVITDVPDEINVAGNASEDGYRKLWRTFYDTIAVESRVNYKLQRNHLPLRYRKYMTEFNREISKPPAPEPPSIFEPPLTLEQPSSFERSPAPEPPRASN